VPALQHFSLPLINQRSQPNLPRSGNLGERFRQVFVARKEMCPFLDVNIKRGFGHLIPIFADVVSLEESNQLSERAKLADGFDFACHHISSDSMQAQISSISRSG
jgi:hypothetical protein